MSASIRPPSCPSDRSMPGTTGRPRADRPASQDARTVSCCTPHRESGMSGSIVGAIPGTFIVVGIVVLERDPAGVRRLALLFFKKNIGSDE